MKLHSSFEDMPVWQKGMELAQKIYAVTKEDDYLQLRTIIDQIWKELNALISSLRKKTQPQP